MSLLPFKLQNTASLGNSILGKPTTTMPYAPSVVDPDYAVTIHQEGYDGKPETTVTLHLPEELSLSASSEWDTPFSDGIIPERRLQLLAQLAGFSPTVQAMTAHFWKGSSPIEITLPVVVVAYNSSREITDKVLKLKSLVMPTKEPNTGWLQAPGPRLELNTEAASRMWSSMKDTGAAAVRLPGEMVTGGSNGEVTANNTTASNTDKGFLDSLKKPMQGVVSAAADLINVKGKILIQVGNFLRFPDMIIKDVSDQYNVIMGVDGKPQRVSLTIQAVTRVTPVYEDLERIYMTTTQTGKNPPGFIQRGKT